MVISADFEKQKQYFDQENIASSILLYLFIAMACENCPSDEGLKKKEQKIVHEFSHLPSCVSPLQIQFRNCFQAQIF